MIYRKYANGDDATNVVVLFCRQSHLVEQNMGKMPKFASLLNYTYQINNTLNKGFLGQVMVLDYIDS